MEIIAGPRFDGSLCDRISAKAKKLVSIDHLGSSIFSGKLNNIYCDRCTAHKKIIKSRRDVVEQSKEFLLDKFI